MNFDSIYCSGRLKLQTAAVEMRMSHTVCPPVVTLLSTGEICLNLMGSLWDLCGLEETDTGIRLTLREYPGGMPNAVVDVNAQSGELTVGGVVTPKENLEQVIGAR